MMPKISITDPDDPQIAVFQGLRDHVLRQKRELPSGDMGGIFICEGDIPVGRALEAGYQLESILVDAKRRKAMPSYLDETVTVYAASPEVLMRITGYNIHRGAIACFKRRSLITPQDLLTQIVQDKTLLVLEGINNPTNMGVMLRCAAGLGVGGVLLDKTCSDPLYRRAVRVSMGEAFALPYARFGTITEGLELIHKAGYETWAMTPGPDAVALHQMKKPASGKVALLLGTEAAGLTNEALLGADKQVKIAMSGKVDSINVGAAAAIAFYATQTLS